MGNVVPTVIQLFQVANTISDKLTARVFQLCLDKLKELLDYYRAAIQSYKNKHFEDRKQMCPFTLFTIAAINNCGSFQENLTKAAGKYGSMCKLANNKDFNLDNQVPWYQKKGCTPFCPTRIDSAILFQTDRICRNCTNWNGLFSLQRLRQFSRS